MSGSSNSSWKRDSRYDKRYLNLAGNSFVFVAEKITPLTFEF
jgi:hypothetical protein